MKRKTVNIICIISIILLFGITFTYQKMSINNLTTDVKDIHSIVNESTYILIFVISAFLIFFSLLLYLFIDRYQSLSLKNEIKKQKIENPINNFSELEFKKEVFDLYKKVKENYAERNIDALKELLSKELFEKYKLKLEKEEQEKTKSIIENIKMEDINIIKINDNINYYDILVNVRVTYKNYIINEDSFIVKGDVSKDITNNIDLLVVKNKRIKEIKNCPNCYHTLTNYDSNKCEYCNSVIVESSDTLKLAKEEKVKK